MNLLFIHQNFPGQFRHIAAHFAADPMHRVIGIGEAPNMRQATAIHTGIVQRPYDSPVSGAAAAHPYVQNYDGAVRRGLAVARVAEQLKAEGFAPEIVVAHPGWGEALYLRDLFPDARLVHHAEFFYHARGSDVGFDPEFPSVGDDAFRMRTKNTTQFMSMNQADLLLAPTEWQKRQFPPSLRERMEVVHDGIDTERVRPDPSARISLGRSGVTLGAGDEVLTYVARNLEPYRGFHVFMRALPEFLRLRPKARVLIVGGDAVSYGSRAPGGVTWRNVMLEEVGAKLDLSRVHFLGRVAYADYLRLLQVSTVHAYLTYPFVLSWSLLEAMACGCMIVASKTPPVEEVVEHGRNGWLTDFFDHQALARMLADSIGQRAQLAELRRAARDTIVNRYDLKTVCLPRQLQLLAELGR